MARWLRSVCPRGPVVPWSRLASLSLALSFFAVWGPRSGIIMLVSYTILWCYIILGSYTILLCYIILGS